MPRHFRNVIYYSEDWNVMQSALLKATRKLHRAQGHEDTDAVQQGSPRRRSHCARSCQAGNANC
jgi:hypothetical protein